MGALLCCSLVHDLITILHPNGRTTELKSWNDELMARSMLEPAPRASNSARHGFGLPGCGERQVDAIDGFAEEFTALSVPYSPLS